MRLSSFNPVFCALLGIGVAAANSHSQVPERHLEADAEFPEGFSIVSGLREMPDGRLMVADAIGQFVAFIDFGTGDMEIIGREGQGPAEYRIPDALYPLPGDSTLLVDLGNGRLTALGPNGEFGPTQPIARQVGDQMVVTIPVGVDGQGRVYFQPLAMSGRMRMRGSGPELPDSAAIARWDRRTDVIDTLGAVKIETMRVSTSGRSNSRNVQVRPVPMSPLDAWNVAPNGMVAVARSPEYYVEWIGDSETRRGHLVDYDPERVGRSEKEAWVESTSRGGLSMMVTMNNGVRTMSFGRGSGSDRPDVSGYEWPETMPPFYVRQAVLVDLDGNAWVQRSVPAGSAQLYDVFGSAGELTERVVLPPGREIVGFGQDVAYAVYYDEFDLQWLERYRM